LKKFKAPDRGAICASRIGIKERAKRKKPLIGLDSSMTEEKKGNHCLLPGQGGKQSKTGEASQNYLSTLGPA